MRIVLARLASTSNNANNLQSILEIMSSYVCIHSGKRDAAMIELLLGFGLRRSEAVILRLDQLQSRESHCVIVDLVGKGGRLRTVSVPTRCKSLIDVWLRGSRVTEGKVFRRVSKHGARQDAEVTTSAVWYAVKRYAS